MSDDNARKCYCGLEPCVCKDFPEPYSKAYYSRLLTGNVRLMNLLAAEYTDSWAAIKELRARVDFLEYGRREDMAEIGRLSAELDAAKDSIAKAREAYRELKNGRQP